MQIKRPFEIDCEDIVLREFQEAYVDGIYQMSLQPEIQEFLSDWVATREKRHEWMLQYDIPENDRFFQALPHISMLENDPLRLAIILKETDEFIGWIVSGFKDELPPPNREIGYGISNLHTGKGYATKATKALIKFLFEHSDTEELVATAVTYNEASNVVLKKCGYRFEGTTEIDQKPYNCYRLTKQECVTCPKKTE